MEPPYQICWHQVEPVIQLKSQLEQEIHQQLGRRTHSGLKLLRFLFKNPAVNVKRVEEICQLSKKAANGLVNTFEEKKWLKKVGNQERYRTFIFDPYLRLFE